MTSRLLRDFSDDSSRAEESVIFPPTSRGMTIEEASYQIDISRYYRNAYAAAYRNHLTALGSTNRKKMSQAVQTELDISTVHPSWISEGHLLISSLFNGIHNTVNLLYHPPQKSQDAVLAQGCGPQKSQDAVSAQGCGRPKRGVKNTPEISHHKARQNDRRFTGFNEVEHQMQVLTSGVFKKNMEHMIYLVTKLKNLSSTASDKLCPVFGLSECTQTDITMLKPTTKEFGQQTEIGSRSTTRNEHDMQRTVPTIKSTGCKDNTLSNAITQSQTVGKDKDFKVPNACGKRDVSRGRTVKKAETGQFSKCKEIGVLSKTKNFIQKNIIASKIVANRGHPNSLKPGVTLTSGCDAKQQKGAGSSRNSSQSNDKPRGASRNRSPFHNRSPCRRKFTKL